MQVGRFAIVLLLAGSIAACGGGGGDDSSAPSTPPASGGSNPGSGTPQTAAPTVSLTSPDSGGPLSGEMQLAADIKSDTAIASVVFTVDDAVVAQRDAAPFTATWNSVHVNDGEHLLRVTATNSAGQSGTDDITVRTRNAAARKIPINLTPFGAQNPDTGAVLSHAELFEKLAPWRHRASCVRTFGVSGGLDRVPQIAAELGIDCVAITIWLGRDLAANEKEIAKAIALVKSASNVKYVAVGSETLLRGDLAVGELIAYIVKVQAELADKVVTTSEAPSGWLDHQQLVDAVPQVWVTVYPFLGGAPLDVAIAVLNTQYQELQAHAHGKTIVISETGWPTCGSAVGAAIPSEANSASYALNFISWAATAGVPYFLFGSSDEPFKAVAHGTAYEGCWGLTRDDASFKAGLEDVFAGRVVSDNWSDVPCSHGGELPCAPIPVAPANRDQTDATPTLVFTRRSTEDMNPASENFLIQVNDVNGLTVNTAGLTREMLGCADDRTCEYPSPALALPFRRAPSVRMERKR